MPISKITTKMKYTGENGIKNFMLFESIPKTFANNASLVDVTAPAGTQTEIAEEDPSWVIYFPTLNTGQEFTVTYEVSGTKSSSVLDGMTSEVYAESLEEAAAAPGEGEPEGKVGGEEAPEAGPRAAAPFKLDMNTILMIVVGVVVVVVIVLAVFLSKPEKRLPRLHLQ